jgi:hypothetical protein
MKGLVRGTRGLGIATVLAVCGAVTAPVHADENIFGYVYGSETLPKGEWEAYQWATWRHGKGAGSYDAVDLKTELEYGITDRFQASAYLNTIYQRIRDTGPIEDDGTREFQNTTGFGFQGVAMELKYALTSPYKDPLGIALYLEPSYSRINRVSGASGTEYEIEPKLILQKNFMEDRLIAAMNISGEFEWERYPDNSPTERELKLEVSAGLSYQFAPNWYAGVEGKVQSIYANMNLGDREAWAVFAGPSIHYAVKKWWVTLAVLPQIMGGPRDPALSSRLHLDEFERTEVRLKFGYEF